MKEGITPFVNGSQKRDGKSVDSQGERESQRKRVRKREREKDSLEAEHHKPIHTLGWKFVTKTLRIIFIKTWTTTPISLDYNSHHLPPEECCSAVSAKSKVYPLI